MAVTRFSLFLLPNPETTKHENTYKTYNYSVHRYNPDLYDRLQPKNTR